MVSDALIPADEAAGRLGMLRKTFLKACVHGKVAGAVRNPEWPRNAPCWWVPEDVVTNVRRDRAGRIIWKPQALRDKPGFKRGYFVRDSRPRCKRCKIVLEESGDLLHPPDKPDAGKCWMCRGKR